MINVRYKRIRPLVHLLVWSCYFSFMLLPAMLSKSVAGQLYFMTHLLILMVATYVNMLWLVKKYFLQERYKAYIIRVLIVWVVGLIAVVISGLLLQYPDKPEKFIGLSLSAMIGFTMEFFFFAAVKAAKEWYQKSKQSKELEFEKMQAELNLLRSQLDAHFIFNTLNNLYLLVLNKSEKAPEAVLMLSDMLSYTIYESRQERVSLHKEFGFLDNYINLQRMRLDATQVIYYEVKGEQTGVIEPLVLFNFIENVFKHGTGFVIVGGIAYYAYILIEVNNGELTLKTKNGKSGVGNDTVHKGVGVVNAVKRLDLAYGDKYKLDIQDDADEYKLTLVIQELL